MNFQPEFRRRESLKAAPTALPAPLCELAKTSFMMKVVGSREERTSLLKRSFLGSGENQGSRKSTSKEMSGSFGLPRSSKTYTKELSQPEDEHLQSILCRTSTIQNADYPRVIPDFSSFRVKFVHDETAWVACTLLRQREIRQYFNQQTLVTRLSRRLRILREQDTDAYRPFGRRYVARWSKNRPKRPPEFSFQIDEGFFVNEPFASQNQRTLEPLTLDWQSGELDVEESLTHEFVSPSYLELGGHVVATPANKEVFFPLMLELTDYESLVNLETADPEWAH